MKFDKRKMLAVLAAVLLFAGLILAYYWYQGTYYVSTIDARVSAKMANITPQTAGKLVTFTGDIGQMVTRDEKLGTVDGGTAVSSLNAPISGTLVKINVNEGQTVSIGQTAAVVADMDSLFISTNIEETKISKCAVGQGVEIRIDAYPGEVFFGSVSSIGEAATSVFSSMSTSNSNGNYTKITQLIPVEIAFAEEYQEDFKVGMNAEIKIHVK